MTILDRLLGRPEPIVHQPSASARKASTGDGWLTAYQQGGIPLSMTSGDEQTKARRLLGAYKVGWFNKAERRISTDFAGLAVSVAPEDAEGDNERTVIEPDLKLPWDSLDPVGRFLRLMERPNLYQTGRQLRQKTMIRLDMAGWTFWYTELGTDRLPIENGLYGISPARLWPSYDKAGILIGYVLDKNREGGGVPFEVEEIIPFSYESADDAMGYGVGVVEAIWAQIPLTDLMAKHTADVLATGGRLAGAMWPKERALDEAEFEDAKRAWRSVVSDPNAARRLLLFPEPMEWSQGASTPAEIGIPELAALNRDDILTSFPISPYQLGVPMPGGLNSAATRKEDRLDYWMGTIHPRVELFEETIQTYLVSKYEDVVGYTLDFEIAEPNLDDAAALIEKAQALDDLIAAGFDEKEAVAAVALEHIKYLGKPEPPPPPVLPVEAATVQPPPETVPRKATKSVRTERDDVLDLATARALDRLTRFFTDQRQRVEQNLRNALPSTKVGRRIMKAAPDWWDAANEDELLTDTMRGIYLDVGRGGLQAVADTLNRSIVKGFVGNVMADLLEYGGTRVKGINDRTLQALVAQLAEGTRRGYSIPQLIEGVPEEGYGGVLGVTLENGTAAFGELRAETIARTETMLSYNRATIDGYAEFGVTHLLAYDGVDDHECEVRNGEEYSIEDALAEEDHPNGTLVWSPVVDKAEHPRRYETQSEHDGLSLALAKALSDAANRPDTLSLALAKALSESASRPMPTVIVQNGEPKDPIIVPPSEVRVNVDTQEFTAAVADMQRAVLELNVPTDIADLRRTVLDMNVPLLKAVEELRESVTVLNRPKKRTIIRDKDGRIVGLEETA